MAETPNIKLHQWQPNDDFLREEFNQDFAKIDTAVGNLSALLPRVLLKQHTTTVAALQVDVSLAGINFTDYWSLEIYFTGAYTAAISGSVRFNGKSTLGDYIHRTSNNTDGETNYFTWLHVGANSTYLSLNCAVKSVSGLYHIAGEYNYIASAYMPAARGVTLANLTQMNLVSGSGNFPVGTQITIYGVRK